jgi:hypothetical protein
MQNSKIFLYKTLCFFLNQKFWLQFDIINQKLIILFRNISYLTLNKTGESLLNFNKMNLIKYYNQFDILFRSIIPYKTYSLVLIGICRFDFYYLEDKITFLEKHLTILLKHSININLGLYLILRELVIYKTFTGGIDLICKLLLQLIYVFRSNFINISNLKYIPFRPFRMILEKVIRKHNNTANINIIYNSILKFIIYFNKNEIRKKKNRKHHFFLNKSLIEKSFNFVNNFSCFFCNLKDEEKENWCQINNIFRVKSTNNTIGSFLEKIHLYYYLYSLFIKKKIYKSQIYHILNENLKTDSLRISIIGKWIKLNPLEIDFVLKKISIVYKIPNIIDKSRQILKYNKQKILFKNMNYAGFTDRVQKKILQILLYENCLFFIKIIRKKLNKKN